MKSIDTIMKKMSYSPPLTEVTLANSKAFKFVLKEYTELVLRGHSVDHLTIENDHKVTYIQWRDQVVSAVVWDFRKDLRVLRTHLSVTSPDHQRQGLITLIHAEIERIGAEGGAKVVVSHVHIDNHNMREGFVKMGKLPVTVQTRKEL